MFKKEISYVMLCNDAGHASDVIYRYLYRMSYSLDFGDFTFQTVRSNGVEGYFDSVANLKAKLAGFLTVSFINNRSRSVVFDVTSLMTDVNCGQCVVTPGMAGNMLVKIRIEQGFEARREFTHVRPDHCDTPAYVSIRVFDEYQTIEMFRRDVDSLLGVDSEIFCSSLQYSRPLVDHFKDNILKWTVKSEDSPIDFGIISTNSKFLFDPDNGVGEFILTPYDDYKISVDIHDKRNQRFFLPLLSVISASACGM